MMDVRDYSFGKKIHNALPPKRMDYSPFHYLRQLLLLPALCWFLLHETLHKMAVQWLLEHPGGNTIVNACAKNANAPCDVYAVVKLTHGFASGLLAVNVAFLLLLFGVTKASLHWRQRLLRHAGAFLNTGLLLTVLLVIVRGAVLTLTMWCLPTVWWGADAIGVKAAAIVGMVALVRVPPLIQAAWLLCVRFERRRTGKILTPEECPALWNLLVQECKHLRVAVPDTLLLGVFPDCRLECGTLILDPVGTIIKGRILYLGAPLAVSLTEEQLRVVVRHALMRNRGEMGTWLPWAEDWVEAKDAYLQERKLQRSLRELPGSGDAALYFCDEWLTQLKRMLPAFQPEHRHRQAMDMQEQAAAESAMATSILNAAREAYRHDVFHIFVVDLGSGVQCPAVFVLFARAFSKRLPRQHYKDASNYIATKLAEELVLIEKEWLIKTAQASTPTDHWELRTA